MTRNNLWLLQNNVLVGENGTTVLADFGLAKAIVSASNRGQTTKQGWGTTNYMWASLLCSCVADL